MTTTTDVEPRPLTDRQRAIYEFLYGTTRDTGIQPGVREVMERFGIGTTNGVECHLRALARAGWIDMAAGKSRSIRFLFTPAGKKFDGFADKG